MKKNLLLLFFFTLVLYAEPVLDILSKGAYSFTPDKSFYNENLIVEQFINSVWAKKDTGGKFYSVFPGTHHFSTAPIEDFSGRISSKHNDTGELIVGHFISDNMQIFCWDLSLISRPDGGGELGILLAGSSLKEGAAVLINEQQSGIFSQNKDANRNLGKLDKSGKITIEGKFNYHINVVVPHPEQIYGIYVQKHREGIRVIAPYNFKNDNRKIKLLMSLSLDEDAYLSESAANKIFAAMDTKKAKESFVFENKLKPDNKLNNDYELLREKHDASSAEKSHYYKSFVCSNEEMKIILQKKTEYASTFDWQLKSEAGLLMNSGRINLAVDESTYDFIFKIARNGCYRLEVTDGSGLKREALFAVFPALEEAPGKDGILGATGVQFGLFDLAEICGLSWHRWHCGYVDSRLRRIFADGKLITERIEEGLKLDKDIGMHVLGSLMYYQDINAMTDEQFKNFLQEWSEYVKILIKYLHKRVEYYEVFNEPYYTFKNYPKRYVELQKITKEIIRDLDPEIKIVGVCGPPISMGDKFFRDVLKDGINDFDIMSFHQYCFSDKLATNSEKSFEDWILYLQKLCEEYGRPDMELWNSESSTSLTTTLYRLPENLKKINKSDECIKVRAYEQAAVFSRVLAIHYAYNVKYFFHLFGASSTYSCHITEFDGTPLPTAVAMAAVNRRLEGAKLVYSDSPEKRVKNFQFSKKGKWVAALWLEQIHQQEKVIVTLPEEAKDIKLYDFLGNQLDLAGKQITVTAEPFFVEFSGNTRPGSEWEISLSEISSDTIRSLPAGVETGSDSDWESYYYKVPLHRIANRSLTDEVAGDQIGGFTDEGVNDLRNLPLGNLRISNIPYYIISAEKNNDKSVVVLNGFERPYFPSSVTLPLPDLPRLAKFYILHLSTYSYTQNKEKPVYELLVTYDDDSTENFPMYLNQDIADWFNVKQSRVEQALVTHNAIGEVAIFKKEVEFNNPRGPWTRVKEIRITSEEGGAIPVILSITGVLSN